MKPEHLDLLQLPGRPAVTPDGTVLVAVSRPDPENDRYVGHLHRVTADGITEFTRGPRDSAPILSPDGHTLVFLRAAGSGPAQLYSVDLRGGEPRSLADHPLGASNPVFAPDGSGIAYLAAVPEPGRYGTDDDVAADGEPPRRIDRLAYRLDGKGFTRDKPAQVFRLELAEGAEPQQLTDDPEVFGGPAFRSDGAVLYLRHATPDGLHGELAVVVGSDGAMPVVGESVAVLPGRVGSLVVQGDRAYVTSTEFEGIDIAGRTLGLWVLSATGGPLRRLTDQEIEVDPAAPVVLEHHVLVAVLDRGTVGLRAVPVDADHAGLGELPVVLAGPRVVTSFAAHARTDGSAVVAAVVSDPTSPGEVVVVEFEGATVGPESTRTSFASGLGATGLARQEELTATAPDGYPVHGFLVRPDGPGPHPTLLVVHGGPHAAYGWGLFDEAQVYAAAGYAVVLPNPRGSSGYGHEHGRSLLGRLGTVDVDDVLALLDAALARPDCDADRVGVMGGSYGGFMTSWLASHAPGRFTAAISERAVNAWDSFAGSSDIGYYFAENYAGADRDSQWAASPLAYADQIELPMLIIHSEHDWRCPLEQGQRMYVALKKRGAPAEMLLFPAEGHELSRSGRPRHRGQRFDAILDWWDRHLPVSSPQG